MELKDKLLSFFFMAFEEKIDTNSELHELKSRHKNFENKGSQQKREAWKYTSLNAILKNDFRFSKERKRNRI